MSEPDKSESEAQGFIEYHIAAARSWVHSMENWAITLTLAVMIILPLLGILLRKVNLSISSSPAIVQHLTLIVGMLGGAIAARESRLLSLSTIPNLLKGWLKTTVNIGSAAFATMICAYLCYAGYQFVVSEKDGGAILAYGVPVWVIELALPIGFASITWRIARRSSKKWAGRITTLVLAGLLVLLALHPPLPPEKMVIPALVALVVATLLGAPVFTTLGGAALILFWGVDLPIASLPLDHYRLVTNPTLPTIPLFTLAGYFLAEGGASKRLMRVFLALFGQYRGGPAIVTPLICAFFTTFTGASGVTILALGGLLMPMLLAARYSEKNALGMLTSAGSLGLLFPPCLPLILFAIIAKSVTIEQIFLAGILPGVVMVIANMWLGIYLGPKDNFQRQAFSWQEARQAIWVAKWELFLPAVAFIGLLGGFATPVEAAALTAFYAFCAETFIYRDLKLVKDIPRVVTECGLLVGGVLLVLGVALGFTNYLVEAQIPAQLVEWVTKSIHSPLLFLLLLNVFLLLVGCVMDIFSAIVVVVPLIVPLGLAYGISPVHLGIIFLANLELGYLLPPIGINLYLASYRFNKTLPEVYRAVFPMLVVQFIAVLLITYVPPLSTTLPRWFTK